MRTPSAWSVIRRGHIQARATRDAYDFRARHDTGRHNWLVHAIHDESLEEVVKRYARGVLVDIGCGEKPYAAMTRPYVSQHLGVDHPETSHSQVNVDVFSSAYETTLPSETADTVLSTAVLEHVERPLDAVREMFRILKPGGHVILSAPLFWHLHEEPRDFYRYTQYGLKYLFTEAGFEVVELRPLSGFFVTFSQELCYVLNRFRRWPIGWLICGLQSCIQYSAYFLRRWDDLEDFTWCYLMVARKPQQETLRRV